MSNFNSLPNEASPALTDRVFTGRGTGAGAERKPLWSAVLSLFRVNLRTRTVVLVSASGSIATDAAAADLISITATGNITLANPTNPTDGRALTWRIRQDATGGRSVTLGDKFRIPDSASQPLGWGQDPNETTIFAAIYNLADDTWDVVSLVPGYQA